MFFLRGHCPASPLGAGSFLPCQASLLAQLWPVQVFGRATGYIGLIVITGVVPAARGRRRGL